ncbi:MAG: sulfatase-like hydrolase/transferase, partial [Flavobacteriia bacterium]
ENHLQDKFFKNNSWGHPDNHLFEKILLDDKKIHKNILKPKLDIFLTISTHGPFQIPNQEKYKKDLLADLKSNKIKSNYHSTIKKNLEAFSTYRFTDENLRKYFAEVKKNPAYKNTIFFIVGDHGSEVHSENELTKLVVPLLIVSDLIKKPQKFEALSSHLDVLPSVLSLLHKNYSIEIPKMVSFMGKGLRLKPHFESDLHQAVATINYKNDVLVYGNYYFYYNQLFQIQKNLKLKAIQNDKLSNDLRQKLKRYDEISYYCYTQNKLINAERTINDLVIKPIINSKDEFINIVKEYNFKEKMSNFKIEITFDYYLNKEKDIENIPSYVTTLNDKDSIINWKGTPAKLNQKFKKGWNQMKYTIMLDESILQNKNNLNLGHYIYNYKKIGIKKRNVKYKSYKNI